jgi:hypothetical protein
MPTRELVLVLVQNKQARVLLAARVLLSLAGVAGIWQYHLGKVINPGLYRRVRYPRRRTAIPMSDQTNT